MLTTPYTYLVGWPSHNRWYYGVRYAEGCNPADLWVTYFTSSKYVAEFTELYGAPTYKQVRKTFTDIPTARSWESKVLKRLQVTKKEIWLNKNDRMAPPILLGDLNPMRNPDVARKSGQAKKAKGIKKTAKWKANHSATMTGRKQSVEAKEKKRVAMLEFGDEHHSKTKEFRLARSKGLVGNNNPSKRLRQVCLHCNTEAGVGNYTKWHGDNCRQNPSNVSMLPRKNPTKLCGCCQQFIGVNAHKRHELACFRQTPS